jgi:signal transduction histidine kinase
MQATQSSTASGFDVRPEQFVALRYVTRQMNLVRDEVPEAVEPVGMADEVSGVIELTGVAEGAGLAHDAGNLLGALSLYSDLLALPGVLHEEHREYAAELRMLSDRSWAMINRLVNHARVEQEAVGAPETAVIPEVVDRCRGLLGKIAGRPVKLWYGADAFKRVGVPAEAIERILCNLVKNAGEATPIDGTITVRVEGHDDVRQSVGGGGVRQRIVLTVSDTGCGIGSGLVKSLLQSGGISPSGGRGLGFRVVRELVAMSGGCLSIESQPGVGTSVSAEWYALKSAEVSGAGGERRVADGVRATEPVARGERTVVQGRAGWIAC